MKSHLLKQRILFIAFAVFIILFPLSCGGKKTPDGNIDGVLLGVFHEGSQLDLKPVKTIEEKIDKKFASVMWYVDWSTGFPIKDAKRVYRAGYMPHITWEPWFFEDKDKVRLDDILAGSWDEYIHDWAQNAASFGKPMFLRMGHEFNGNWYPWSLAQNGESPDKYVAAYRKIHDAFREAGADNVLWIWCANATSVPNEPWNDPVTAYPGDDYVDWIGIDGYNFSGSDDFSDIFTRIYSKLVKEFVKPIMVAEFATGGGGEEKAQWLENMGADLMESFPGIRAITWFDIDKERDWRLAEDDLTAAAAKAAFAPEYFQSDSELFLPVTEAYPNRHPIYLAELASLTPEKVTLSASAVRVPDDFALSGSLEQAEAVSLESEEGAENLSAELKLGWNKEALFFTAKITDQNPAFNNKKGMEIWNGDCLEICLGLNEKDDPSREFFTETDSQLGFSPGSAKDGIAPSVWGWASISAHPEGIELSVTPEERSYVIDGKIPWDFLGTDFTPEQGMKLGFDFAVDDSDESGDRVRQVIWNGDASFYSNPSQWGLLVLE